MNNTVFEIKPIEEKDFDWFNECRNLVREYLHNSEYFTREETRIFLSLNKHKYWLISLNDQRVGYVRCVIDGVKKETMIGLDIHPRHQGKSYAKLIYKQFMRRIYDQNMISSFVLRVLKSNTRAINLYLSLGFKSIEETDIDIKMEHFYENSK